MRGSKSTGVCSIDGCGKSIKSLGLCQNHYMRQWMYGRTDKINSGLKRRHPHYVIWFHRKQTGVLAPEWLDFWQFVKDIGDRPGKNFVLIRLDEKPYGPKNFKWQETLRREPGETKKTWYARKWQSRRKAFPNYEDDRALRRKYGMTLPEYEKMLFSQNGVCFICKEEEKAFDARTNGIKRLSVDHCHNTGKNRKLLCSYCNHALGNVKDSIEILTSMIDYLKLHQEKV